LTEGKRLIEHFSTNQGIESMSNDCPTELKLYRL